MPGREVTVADRWEVNMDRRIGDGGFGCVYFGKEIREKLPCAAKRVELANEEHLKAFDHERTILKKVHEHPSVISLMGDAQDDENSAGGSSSRWPRAASSSTGWSRPTSR